MIINEVGFNSVSRFLPIAYLIVVFGIGLQIGGTNWDIIWHGLNNVESFLTPPHTVLYLGVLLVLISIFILVLLIFAKSFPKESNFSFLKKIKFGLFSVKSKIPLSFKLIIIGCAFELFAGFFDNWWHNQFGFDGLLSPPHSFIGIGMLFSLLGVLFGVINLDYRSVNKRLYNLSFVMGFSLMWMVSINFVFLFTLPYSKGQFFDFNPDPFYALLVSNFLLPFLTGIIFFSMIKLTKIPFIFTAIVSFFMIIQSSATLLSNSLIDFFPFYLWNIIPAFIADIVLQIKRDPKSKKLNISLTQNKSIKRIVLSTTIISIFLISLYFPWSINVYKTYFQIPENVFQSHIILNKLLYSFILPILIPLSIVFSIFGILSAVIVSKRIDSGQKIKQIKP